MSIYAAVTIITFENKEVLILKRAINPLDPWSGHISLPGGRIETNESPLEAAIRETHEECNILLNKEDVLAELPIASAGAPNLKVQMDLYHCQIVEGDLAMKIRRYIDGVGHFQIAGVPDRHEPDTGEVDYRFLYKLIDELNFDGWIGCEYTPRTTTEEGLSWARDYGIGP